jgi:plasmid replication initiation protein
MRVLSQFKSTYGLALYENCIRYQNITQTPWFDLPIYRKLMGVEDGKYEIFRDLHKRVIKSSVVEVNNNAPIRVRPELKKQGRSIIAIRFLITKQIEIVAMSQVQQSEADRTIVDRLKEDYGFSAKQVGDVLDKYSEQYLLEKMAIIEASSSYQNGKIEHLAKYLEKALEEDYQPPKSSKDNLERLRLNREKEAKIRKLHEENIQRYRAYQNREMPSVLDNLLEKEKTLIEKDFDKYISSTLYYSVYVKEGLKNLLVRDRFGDFLRTTHSELLASLLPFEEFCKGNNP